MMAHPMCAHLPELPRIPLVVSTRLNTEVDREKLSGSMIAEAPFA